MTSDYNSEFWVWVEKHRNDDTMRLRLKAKDGPEWIKDAINQIENEKKSRRKFLCDEALEQVIPRLMPLSISVEQATSVGVALIHRKLAESLMPSERNVLDMTCGLGVDTAILSTIAGSRVTTIEQNPQIATIADINFNNNDKVTVLSCDSVQFLRDSNHRYNLIFIDPARRSTEGARLYNLHDCTPDVTLILPLLKAKGDSIMIKLSPMLDLTKTIRDLPGITELHIIEQNGECRELLAIITKSQVTEPTITVWTGEKTFSFTKGDEESAQELFALPHQGEILVEPSSAMMKAAPFKLISARYGIAAVHPNTHLYIAKEKITDFPGRQDYIKEILPFSSGNLKRLTKLHLQADVAVRNFAISADALSNRLGIKKSGQERIVGLTAIDGNQYIIRLSPSI